MLNKFSKKQNILFVVLSIGLMAISVLITLYVSGYLSFLTSDKSQGYQNITFTDAAISCEKNTRKQFGRKLKNVYVDNHSSRYDSGSYSYKIFLKADALNKENKVSLFFVNCYVSASNGQIIKFDANEDKEVQKDATHGGYRNIFNWQR